MNDLQEQIQLIEGTTKDYNPKVESRSVVDYPSAEERYSPSGPIVFNIAAVADEFIPFGYNLKGRDLQLRGFYPTEPMLASAVSGMSARLAVQEWEIVGADPHLPNPKNTRRAVTDLLKNADRGNGWHEFVIKVATDLYTQDNGAFIEKIRRDSNPDSPVIGVAHLDSYRCYRTGNLEYPVIYVDRWGVEHKMPWWSVQSIEENPSPIETMYGAQLCAVSRCLRAAQIIRDIAIYKKEKVSGQHTRAIHFISGVTRQNIADGLTLAQEQALNRGLARYINPAIIPTLDPEANLKVETLELASLPDHFDEDETLRWYVTQLAVAFGVDYQEFAPLTGGSLGSGQQSEILHLKSRGKGPALLISIFEHILNDTGILPRNVKFQFKIEDARADEERANARFLRGKDRSLRVDSGELDVEAARKLAQLDGDLPEELLEDMESRPVEPPPQPQPDPTTAAQVQGGINSRRERKSFTNDDARAEAIMRLQRSGELVTTKKPIQITEEDIARQRKRLDMKSVSQGFACLYLWNDPRVVGIMRMLQGLMGDAPVEWTPTPLLHVTLAFAPEVSRSDLLEIAKELNVPYDLILEFDRLDVFENGEERALHIKVKSNAALKELQSQVVSAFSQHGIALSQFSQPDKWAPHITLGYLPKDVEFEPIDIPGGYTMAGCLSLTQGEYELVAEVWPHLEMEPVRESQSY